MKLLTEAQAEEIIAQAGRDITKYPNLRWGQQLWNLLPIVLATEDLDNKEHMRWYNSLDVDYCIQRFYKEFVEKCVNLNHN